MESSYQQFTCSQHPKEWAQVYCYDHSAFCCLDQCLETHNGHKISPSAKLNAFRRDVQSYNNATMAVKELSFIKREVCKIMDDAINKLNKIISNTKVDKQLIKSISKQMGGLPINYLNEEPKAINSIRQFIRKTFIHLEIQKYESVEFNIGDSNNSYTLQKCKIISKLLLIEDVFCFTR